MHLEPLFLYQYASKGLVDELNDAHIMDCMECGACAYTCPARLHLTHMFKTGKQLVKDAAATHLPQRMHWGCSTVCSSFSQKASMQPVPLATGMSAVYWAMPIIGPGGEGRRGQGQGGSRGKKSRR